MSEKLKFPIARCKGGEPSGKKNACRSTASEIEPVDQEMAPRIELCDSHPVPTRQPERSKGFYPGSPMTLIGALLAHK